MNIQNITKKARVTRTGLSIRPEVTFMEWRALAPWVGAAAVNIEFVIGDWLLYGEKHFLQPSIPDFKDLNPWRRVENEPYNHAINAADMDPGILQQCADKARNMPLAARRQLFTRKRLKALEEDKYYVDSPAYRKGYNAGKKAARRGLKRAVRFHATL